MKRKDDELSEHKLKSFFDYEEENIFPGLNDEEAPLESKTASEAPLESKTASDEFLEAVSSGNQKEALKMLKDGGDSFASELDKSRIWRKIFDNKKQARELFKCAILDINPNMVDLILEKFKHEKGEEKASRFFEYEGGKERGSFFDRTADEFIEIHRDKLSSLMFNRNRNEKDKLEKMIFTLCEECFHNTDRTKADHGPTLVLLSLAGLQFLAVRRPSNSCKPNYAESERVECDIPFPLNR